MPQPRLVCAEYFRSRVVVEATLLPNVKAVHSPDDPEGIERFIYTLHTRSVLRGNIGTSFLVSEMNASGRATFGWTPGTTYLLFLTYSPAERVWVLDGCGNSGPLEKSGIALAEIRRLRSTHGNGRIEGGLDNVLIQGIHVMAISKAGSFRAETDEKGHFKIKVPPGHYRLIVRDPELAFVPMDLSYENPRSIRVTQGACAQVQFSVRPTKSPGTKR